MFPFFKIDHGVLKFVPLFIFNTRNHQVYENLFDSSRYWLQSQLVLTVWWWLAGCGRRFNKTILTHWICLVWFMLPTRLIGQSCTVLNSYGIICVACVTILQCIEVVFILILPSKLYFILLHTYIHTFTPVSHYGRKRLWSIYFRV